MSSASSPSGRRAGLPFILVVVFIDVLGIGIAIPVLPMLVGEYTASRELQAYWYGALVVVYGIMQFFCAPLLGALSDRFGRRPVLLWSLLGLGLQRGAFGHDWWAFYGLLSNYHPIYDHAACSGVLASTSMPPACARRRAIS